MIAAQYHLNLHGVVQWCVCPLLLAQRLKQLGLPQEAVFSYWRNQYGAWHLHQNPDDFRETFEIVEVVAAYTGTELGAMLPPLATTWRYLDDPEKWCCALEGLGEYAGKSEAEARAKLLLRINGVIDPDMPLDIPKDVA